MISVAVVKNERDHEKNLFLSFMIQYWDVIGQLVVDHRERKRTPC